MSRSVRLTTIATMTWTVWAVVTALSLEARAPGLALALASAAVPSAMLLLSERMRSPEAADRLVAWSLPAAMLMVFIVDLVAWALDR